MKPYSFSDIKGKGMCLKCVHVGAGVVISMVSGKNGEGYALLLDGSTFEEIARAKFPYGLPYGLHGCWVPKN